MARGPSYKMSQFPVHTDSIKETSMLHLKSKNPNQKTK